MGQLHMVAILAIDLKSTLTAQYQANEKAISKGD
jgi:hypothetical protein